MGADWREEFETLMGEAGDASPGDGRTLFERAIDLADRHRDEDAGWDARMGYIDVCSTLGRTQDAFSAYVWCLTCADRSPERLAEVEEQAGYGDGLYWCYKWVAEDAAALLDLGHRQLTGLMDDMRQRYERIGLGAKALQSLHAYMLLHLGEEEAAFDAFDKVGSTDHDAISDCAACVLNREIEFMVHRGRHLQALAAAAPILRGRMHCMEVPLFTYDALLESCWQERRRDQGLEIVRSLLPLLRKPGKVLGPAAGAMTFLVRTGNLTRATGLLCSTLPALAGQERTTYGWRYLTAVHLLVARLADLGKRTMNLKAHAGLIGAGDGPQPVPEVLALIERRATGLSAAFDARNGNSTYSRQHFRLLATRADAEDWPLG